MGVRRVCRSVVMTFLAIFDMLVLIVLYILLWSVLAFYFFSANLNDPYFPTLGTAYVRSEYDIVCVLVDFIVDLFERKRITHMPR